MTSSTPTAEAPSQNQKQTTPRTNAETHMVLWKTGSIIRHQLGQWVPASFARNLEKEIKALNETLQLIGGQNNELRTQLAEAREALAAAFTENQNLHCSTTISPKIGWDALERQTVILKPFARHAERKERT